MNAGARPGVGAAEHPHERERGKRGEQQRELPRQRHSGTGARLRDIGPS